MVLEAATRHEFIDEETLLVLAAVADELHQMRMPELPQKYHLCLQRNMQSIMAQGKGEEEQGLSTGEEWGGGGSPAIPCAPVAPRHPRA